MPELRIARSELILGAARSGKTARAESLAAVWLARSSGHRAVFIATAHAWDEEMRERIAQHQRRRAERVPRMATVEDPLELARAIGRHGRADTLIVTDCLTLWLTARLMPQAGAQAGAEPGRAPGEGHEPEGEGEMATGATIARALRACAGPIVLISNEPGPDLRPLAHDARMFLSALGGVNQEAAAACERVTLMSAGRPLTLKGGS
jgi:adenosylcobinamide kinase / adenosylcobinamide-phosphate guanylyltransferase